MVKYNIQRGAKIGTNSNQKTAKKIFEALIVTAHTRLKFISSERAIYADEMKG